MIFSGIKMLVINVKNCEELCELKYVDCTLACSDTNCLIECGRGLTDCVQGKESTHEIKFSENF